MKILTFLFFIMVFNLSAQEKQSTFILYKTAYLEKLENSKKYLIAFAEAMPEEYYGFRPAQVEMTFSEQLNHIQQNMEWLSSTYLNKEESELSMITNEKQRIIANLKFSFNAVSKCVQALNEENMDEKVDFFAGEKNKLQIFNLLQDHVTHHRGQLAVYLNLKGIKPPAYTGW